MDKLNLAEISVFVTIRSSVTLLVWLKIMVKGMRFERYGEKLWLQCGHLAFP